MTTTEELLDISEDLDEIQKHPWTSEELWRVPQNPGKFEGEPILTRILYEFSLNGMEDDGVSFDRGDDYALFSGYQISGKGPLINGILSTNSDGFVSFKTYDTNRELIAAWRDLQKAAEKENHD
jgi:hypothetical protein